MPKALKSMEAAAVFVRTQDGNLWLVNYRQIGRYIQIDRRFKEAVLF